MGYKHGFTLGKFMPPHNGHLHLIREAKKHVDHLTVLVCSLSNEPINGWLRYAWLKKIFEDEQDIKILHITEELPQYPEDDPNFWTLWTTMINKNVLEKEVFFSSENYGDDVAKHLNIDHVCIDLERKTFPVSGTAVRNNPFEMWDYLDPVIQPYFVKRIVLCGAESVGKTTLIKQLAAHYKTNFVEEYGRIYCEIHKPEKLYPADFEFIAKKQLENEDLAAKKANKILFCDTDLIVTEVYSRRYNGSCPQEIINLNRIRKYSLHLLLDIDLPFENDGTRIYLKAEERQGHHDMLEKALVTYEANYRIINGIGPKRLENAIKTIDEYLNS